MARLTAEASAQLLGLTAHFEGKGRPEAIARLRAALSEASRRIDGGAPLARSAPTPYPTLADAGFRWVKVHRYWFAFTADAGGAEALIHAVFDETSDIPARLAAARGNPP